MSHGYSILEMVNAYEKSMAGFKKVTKDIMTNKAQYYGVLSISDSLDLLIALVPATRKNAVYATFYRGWPKKAVAKGEFSIYLSTAILMFPEIKTVKFIKDKWPPKPYGK